MIPRSVSDLLSRMNCRPAEPPRGDFPYRRYYRSMAAALLSGRVAPTDKGPPNMSDVEPVGPPGYLVVKAGSSADTFLKRCREFGLIIEPL